MVPAPSAIVKQACECHFPCCSAYARFEALGVAFQGHLSDGRIKHVAIVRGMATDIVYCLVPNRARGGRVTAPAC